MKMPTNEERRKLAERLRAVTDEELRFCSIEEIVYGCLANQNCLDSDGNIDEYLALQAIADLIEQEQERTCRIKQHRCTNCDKEINERAYFAKVVLNDGCWTAESRTANYCPCCGAKVVSDD